MADKLLVTFIMIGKAQQAFCKFFHANASVKTVLQYAVAKFNGECDGLGAPPLRNKVEDWRSLPPPLS